MQPQTLLKYAESVDSFLAWARSSRLSTKTDRGADKALARYLHSLFEDGVALTVGSYAVYGYIVLKTVPDRPERDMLPLSKAALTAWRGSRAGGSRVGMVPQVIYHFAAHCTRNGDMDAAAAVLLQYDLYTRPSEILQLRGRDLVPSVAAFNSPWGVLLGNSTFGETTKAGPSDDVVLADSPHRSWAQVLLKRIGSQVCGLDQRIFSLDLARYEKLFRDFSKLSGLRSGLFTPHVVRHSGPSFDLLNRYRTFEEIQARGRWAAMQSVARYRKPGRLLMTASQLPPAFKHYSDEPLHEALKRLHLHSWA